jgi:hypothetical protein
MIATHITCLIFIIFIWKQYKSFYLCKTCGTRLLSIAFQVRDEAWVETSDMWVVVKEYLNAIPCYTTCVWK